MADTELRIGAQTRAANLVGEALPDISRRLQQVGEDLEAQMAGFQGASAAAFGEAVSGWLGAASQLPGALSTYATKLIETDQTSARNDAQQSTGFLRLQGRLGGTGGPQ